ncbi:MULTISPECIES: DUF935 family protein [Pseudoalteromonas]|uniref:phage portal protein family protein n=1 Tax=Pseudoalteromonas TaxID=53246 RepID=UPI0002C9F644|nr:MULTISPECIES: DUF935 family protein [Pseudoalteromonas]ENN99777.1 hypothetical protein J139_04210 [Pseudoalteromonas agarivorans S816]MDC9565846.1 DUF935 family protein [Pseudoalteromonas sp. GAB2316C]MDC9570179.1 DUF935 family protein [Pseudoalteromonas sp. GABNB9D]MDC9574369.1 DUF935 family protein [Pseudoalteromonas sp. GABNS16A]MDC9578710.1 DUF935 family protein [Pseudoalteromonas sp. GABNS16E]
MFKSKPRIKSNAYAALTRMFDQNRLDPSLTSLITELPNPDPILRRAGKNTAIYEEIARDAHVIGELRSLRSGLFSFNTELVPGGDDAASLKSYELAKAFFARKPCAHSEWADMDWHNYSAILNGFSVTHLGKYIKQDGHWQPEYVETWRNSRFAFNSDHELLVKTSDKPQGEIIDPRRWSCVRHMPSAENPYGIALLSSCFWPWTFKHGGFKFFVQLCERFGIPFPVGKYPIGSKDSDINNLLDGLAKLVQDGIAAIPDDTSIDIIESKLSGEPVPERLVNFCNAEISKALTSQTLATEQKNGGARAASETHAKRAGDNQRSDRALVASYRNQLLNSLHTVNFDGGEPPKFIFKDKREINTDTVTRVRETARIVPVGEEWAYQELGVPKPKDGEAILDVPDEGHGIATPAKTEFAKKPTDSVELTSEFDVFDHASDDTIKQIYQFAQAAKSLDELKQKITSQFPDISNSALADVAQTAMEYEFMAGMNEANSKTVEIDDE